MLEIRRGRGAVLYGGEMNESMIERVARALCIADGRDPDEDWRVGPTGLFAEVHIKPGEEQRWRTYVRKVRAAFAEIERLGFVVVPREPTEEMVASGHLSMDRDGWDGAKTCWEWMIAAALAEDPAK